MSTPEPRVVRTFNNNAVLATTGEDEFVLVGRGIGFGRKPGDVIENDNVQRQYMEVSPDRVQFLSSLTSVDPAVFHAVSAAVDLAVDLLGDLHPSVYVLLVDHLSFAVQRTREGDLISNNLQSEISAVFPQEYSAAELIVQYINTQLNMTLPVDEAAYIALHLNAARSGVTVKQPLAKANLLGSLVAIVTASVDKAPDDELVSYLARLVTRIKAGEIRHCGPSLVLSRELPFECSIARQVIEHIDTDVSAQKVSGEVAYLALFLHGWSQSVK